jgi:hypothetical protein
MFPRLHFPISFSLFAIFILLLAPGIASAQKRLPRFEDFRVTKLSRQPPGRIDFSDRGARMYRTRLTDAAKNKPNFAGHYVITDWGCGTECIVPVAIDAQTGKAYFFGFTVSYSPVATESAMDYHLNSRLIVINGYLEDEHGQKEHGTYYYEWRSNRLILLRFVKKPFRDPAAR